MERMPVEGKRRLGEGARGTHPRRKSGSRNLSTVKRDTVALRDLYHNPDPLFRLIGESNETKLIIENKTIKGLVDSGAQVSSISDTLAKKLGLQIQKLETLLELEPTGGGTVPHDGYVKVRLKIPNVRAFDLDVLMLVIPESQYARKVPVTLGTIHIDEIITGQARLIRSHSSARFCFELSGNSNYIIHCNSNYVQNFELEINSI